VAKIYYEDGKLQSEIMYKNGKKNGLAKYYYKDGQLKSEESYKNGKIEGKQKMYTESGTISFIDTYKDGTQINWQIFDQEGKLHREVNFYQNP